MSVCSTSSSSSRSRISGHASLRTSAMAGGSSRPASLMTTAGRLDPAAIAEVRNDAWPDIRDRDELDDVLQTLIALPEDFTSPRDSQIAEEWGRYFEALVAERRAARAISGGRVFWVA